MVYREVSPAYTWKNAVVSHFHFVRGFRLLEEAAWVQATLDAPAEVTAGAYFYIGWTGPGMEEDKIAIG